MMVKKEQEQKKMLCAPNILSKHACFRNKCRDWRPYRAGRPKQLTIVASSVDRQEKDVPETPKPPKSTESANSDEVLLLQLRNELGNGEFFKRCEEALPRPPWGLEEVIKVMKYGIPLGLLLVGLQLLSLTQGLPVPADGNILQNAAALHLGQEALLSSSIVMLLWASVGGTDPWSKGMFQYDINTKWILTVMALCAILFPVVDPLLYTPWTAVIHQASCLVGNGTCGDAAAGGGLVPLLLPQTISPEGTVPAVTSAMPFKDSLTILAQNGDYLSLGMHFAATCLVGPFWEETFWRGFLLPSMASQLPGELPLAVMASSLTFASMHLSPTAWLPILVLSSVSDMLYLRSGSIGPPLLLHIAWNSYQLLGVAFFAKEVFV